MIELQKGFTLIEVLGVIVVLSVISLITVPIIDKTLNNGKKNLDEVQKKQLIKALKDYYTDYEHYKEITEGEEVCLTIDELNKTGYLPNNVKNMKSGSQYDRDTKVCVKKTCFESDSYYENSCKNDYYVVE